MRVLVADDNTEIRSALRLALHEVSDQWEADDEERTEAAAAHCTVLEAVDATDALILLKNSDIDLLLLDWDLPGLDAEKALPRIRARMPRCTMIAMSGRPEVQDRSLRSGADYFVGRNDPPVRLLGILREIWDAQQTAPER